MIDVLFWAAIYNVSQPICDWWQSTGGSEAYRNKPVAKKHHHLMSGKWQHVDSHKNCKMTWRLYSSIKQRKPTCISVYI